MDRSVFDEITKINKGNTMPIMTSMYLLSKHATVDLKTNSDDYKLYYECEVDDLLKSDITNDDLIEAFKSGGWDLSEDKTKLRKFL